ncbi:MAG: alpha/beta hydrolase [Bacteroidota bacterium]
MESTTEPRFIPAKVPPIGIKKDQQYQFGYLIVPENRSNPKSKSIQLPVYIFKSRNPNPQLDPIIYTVGGPGYTTMTSAPYMNYYSYLDDRDFILFEQRGTAYAKPSLNCPEWSEAIAETDSPNFNVDKRDSILTLAAAACKERLKAEGIDLNAYHTQAIAADIADLRKVLGLKSYNLLTMSYSTKIAQVMLRDFPEGIRSVVMDGSLPLAARYDEESNANLMQAVDKLLSDCGADPACAEEFPSLKSRFLEFLESKNEAPLSIQVTNPNTKAQEQFYLRGRDLISAFTAAPTSAVPSIPSEMEKILSGDYSTIQASLAELFEEPGNGVGIGMRLSVWCAEEYPFNNQKTIKQETENYPAIQGRSPAVYKSEVCKVWGVQAAPKKEDQAVKSDVPVLLLNGEYDEFTPPHWAAAMQKHLPNSFHLVFPGWKHSVTTNWSNTCGMEAARTFFNDPTQKPELDCWEQLANNKFKRE